MGMLINGQWSDEDRTIENGAYVRPVSPFAEPLPVEVIQQISAEPGRFHLIASLSCPWSHRVILVRAIKGLGQILPFHIAGGPRTEGYRLGRKNTPWQPPGTDHPIEHLHELYALTDPRLTARSTVPVLWDAAEHRIISNESARLLSALDAVRVPTGDMVDWTLSPKHLRTEIEALSEEIQTGLSNAVYRAGKARRQETYLEAVDEVFATLDKLETRLSAHRFLHGDAITETDLRLWPTLARFDLVYHGHFKCCRRRLVEYRNLWAYTRDLFAWPQLSATMDAQAIREAYYGEDLDINPTGIVAVAPDLDWNAPHDRDRLGAPKVWGRTGESLTLTAAHNAPRNSTYASP
ncbi:MAG: glutathione S-transferase C-terminal domain-containing protein [Pseudomonadota bacterium]